MTQITIATTRRFRYMWCKSVLGFNPSVHCARCLRGEYHPDLSPDGMRAGDIQTIELGEAEIYYLCGVSSSWELNLHLPVQKAPGAPGFQIEQPGVTVTVSGGVVRLPIPAVMPDVPREFGTCRNWLFGVGHFQTDAHAALMASTTS